MNSSARTYVTVGGGGVGGNGGRGMALIEGENQQGQTVLMFVAGKTEQSCLTAFFERKNRAGRVIAYNPTQVTRPNLLVVENGIVDEAQLLADGFHISSYPSSAAVSLVPARLPTPIINPRVSERIEHLLSINLCRQYDQCVTNLGDTFQQTQPSRLSASMVQELFAQYQLVVPDDWAERIAQSKAAGGPQDNVQASAFIQAIALIPPNTEKLCTNHRQFQLFAQREQFFPTPPVDGEREDTSPIDASIAPKCR